MRKLIAPAVLAVTFGMIASGAFAADPPKPAKPAAKPAAASMATAKDPKTEACEKSWKAEKKHTAKHSAFIKACVAKG